MLKNKIKIFIVTIVSIISIITPAITAQIQNPLVYNSTYATQRSFVSQRVLDQTMRHTLQPEDEGPHFHRYLPVREWWYFNVVFDKPDSELQNWSAMISFNRLCKMFEQPDMLFITLYDDANKTYGGVTNGERGTLQAIGPGVNVSFEDSYAKGNYPLWYVHTDENYMNQHHRIIIDLYFKAEALPYWVWGNTGQGLSKSPFGYYSINSCEVWGSIVLDGKNYTVHGTGYHDHTWALLMIGGSSLVWDWFSIHFTNGLHGFIWQIFPGTLGRYFSIRPGFGWITDGQNYTDFKVFTLEYLESIETSIPGIKRPQLFKVSSEMFESTLTLQLQTGNMHEYLWGDPPFFEVGLWEGPCFVTGTLSHDDTLQDLSGIGIAEILRIF